ETSAVAPSILTTSTRVPGSYAVPSMYERADHSSPPIRTRPPSESTRWRTTALAPSSAAVPVRSGAGMWRCDFAIGRITASEASEPAMKTISCTTKPGAGQRDDQGDNRGERDRPEEERPGREDLADRERYRR